MIYKTIVFLTILCSLRDSNPGCGVESPVSLAVLDEGSHTKFIAVA